MPSLTSISQALLAVSKIEVVSPYRLFLEAFNFINGCPEVPSNSLPAATLAKLARVIVDAEVPKMIKTTNHCKKLSEERFSEVLVAAACEPIPSLVRDLRAAMFDEVERFESVCMILSVG